jgi:ATP adenylyltransferase
MKRLWAPWRITYLKANKTRDCIFCQKAAERRDRENLILWRGESGFALLNLYPYNNGHLMVAPYQHVPSIEELSPAMLADLMGMVQKSLAALRRAMNPQAFNIGINQGAAAGAGIADHVHIHVVPRWNGDTNFMPVLGETRVVPDFLENSYEQLLQAWQEVEQGNRK